jgi:DNA polymerase delta subunit 1
MSAVTSYGRNMIYKVKEVVEREFRERQVVDVEACLKQGLDPEDASIHDQLPKRLVSAFIVYGDTDSVMVCFGDLQGKQKKRRLGAQQTLSTLWGRQEKEDFVQVRSAAADTIQPVHVILAEVIRMGKEMAQRCTDEFEAPNSLTFETIKLRGCWLNKKRYFALEIEKFIEGERFEDAVKRAKISIKGLEGKRRDNAFINSSTQKQIIRILLYENDIAKMERFIESRMRDLLLGRVDIHELVITKGLAKTEEQYAKGGTKQQHVELKKRMAKRAKFTGEVVPETGDRVPYIVRASTNEAKSSKSAEKASELSEHPLYAQQHAVPINTQYYIDKQIWPAVARIMTAIYEPERCPEIQSAMPQKTKESLRVYKRFFAPSCEHLRVRNVKMAGSYGIGGMTIVLPRCLGCGARIAKGVSCNQCSHTDIVKGLLEKKSLQEKCVQEAWDTCRKCQGGSFEKVTCSNLTCKNFFHREQVKMDLEQIEDRLKRLEF